MPAPRTISSPEPEIPAKILFGPGDLLDLESGQYRIVSTAGRGGFAHVYVVEQVSTRNTYAIKLLALWEVRPDEYDDLNQRFEQEFCAGQVRSDYIVRSHAFGRLSGNPYILMDYCPNGSLAKRLQDFYDQSKYETLALSILKGLTDLHRENIIHRDLKPENILFDAADRPRLMDFGISGYLNSRITTRNFIGLAKQVWGTPLYSPPEQLSHRRSYKATAPAMDIFAFGVLMYEVISGGHYPFGDAKELREDIKAYQAAVNRGEIVPIRTHRPDVPARWESIIRRCLKARPEDRPGSVEEIMQLATAGESPPDLRINGYVPEETYHSVLKVVQGENQGYVYYLVPLLEAIKSKELRIGRRDNGQAGGNDISLPEEGSRYISRQHATLVCKDKSWVVQDGQRGPGDSMQGSTNGTYVNEERLAQGETRVLRDGDVIAIGEFRLAFKTL